MSSYEIVRQRISLLLHTVSYKIMRQRVLLLFCTVSSYEIMRQRISLLLRTMSNNIMRQRISLLYRNVSTYAITRYTGWHCYCFLPHAVFEHLHYFTLLAIWLTYVFDFICLWILYSSAEGNLNLRNRHAVCMSRLVPLNVLSSFSKIPLNITPLECCPFYTV